MCIIPLGTITFGKESKKLGSASLELYRMEVGNVATKKTFLKSYMYNVLKRLATNASLNLFLKKTMK